MARNRVRKELSIEQVQRWVISFLILAVASFPLGAMVAVIHSIVDDDRRGDGIILLVVMAVLGIMAIGAVRIVHRRPIASPLLVLGALPAVAAAIFVL